MRFYPHIQSLFFPYPPKTCRFLGFCLRSVLPPRRLIFPTCILIYYQNGLEMSSIFLDFQIHDDKRGMKMEKKINPFKEKIKIEMIKKGYNQTKMADLLGISNQAFSAWLNGSNPKIETVEKITKILKLPAGYFFQGSGNINKKETIQTPAISADDATWLKNAIPLTSNNTIQLPILADVPAGLPEFSDRDVEMFVDIPRFIFPGADFVVKCIGDSLEPKIHKGDYCVIRKMQEPLDGRAMLVKAESGFCMKVVRKEKDVIKLCSTNPKYKPFTPKELSIIGLIIGHWSRDDKEHWQ